MESLTDKIAVVTGASSGIGKAIAVALAGAGARVCLVSRGRDALMAVAEELKSPRPPMAFTCDITDDAQVARLASAVEQTVGPADILIHSAAAYASGALASTPVEEFDLQYRTNLRAPYVITQRFLPQLRRTRGQVVFINSTTGVNARPLVTQYAAVKHGLRGLADAFRPEVAPDGIRVISVYPGQTATPMQELRHRLERL